MLSVLVLTVFLGIVSRSIASLEYTSTIMNESLTLFVNPFFNFDVTGSGDDSVVYLNINGQIASFHKLYLDVTAKRFDGAEFPIPNNPIPLCDLLEEEVTNQNSILSKLRFSRVFNMEGMHCPIPIGKRKMFPYMFPSHVTLNNDIGCGLFNYETTIKTCNEGKTQNCVPMISANTVIDLQTKSCSNNLT